MEFSSEAMIKAALESTAGDGVLVAAGGKVIDLGAKDRGVGGERSAADEGRVSEGRDEEEDERRLIVFGLFHCSVNRFGRCGNGMWERGNRWTMRRERVAGRGVRRSMATATNDAMRSSERGAVLRQVREIIIIIIQ